MSIKRNITRPGSPKDVKSNLNGRPVGTRYTDALGPNSAPHDCTLRVSPSVSQSVEE